MCAVTGAVTVIGSLYPVKNTEMTAVVGAFAWSKMKWSAPLAISQPRVLPGVTMRFIGRLPPGTADPMNDTDIDVAVTVTVEAFCKASSISIRPRGGPVGVDGAIGRYTSDPPIIGSTVTVTLGADIGKLLKMSMWKTQEIGPGRKGCEEMSGGFRSAVNDPAQAVAKDAAARTVGRRPRAAMTVALGFVDDRASITIATKPSAVGVDLLQVLTQRLDRSVGRPASGARGQTPLLGGVVLGGRHGD